MNINKLNEENKNMKKSTKILLIIFILFLIPAFIFSRYFIWGISVTESGLSLNFDAKGIAGIVFMGLSFVLGIVLYFKFLFSLSVDKMIFFSTIPLVILYGLSLFMLAQLKYMTGEVATSVRNILNITETNSYNTILWAVLLSVTMLSLLFLNYLLICRPITKVEKVVSRLGDGIVKEDKFSIGRGKQFSNIEHGLNKINNNFKHKDSELIGVKTRGKDNFLRPYIKVLGRGTYADLSRGEKVKKRVCVMSIKLIKSREGDLSLEENYEMLNSYLNLIGPLIRRHAGFIDRYNGDGIVCVFNRSENAIECAHVVVKAIKDKNRHNHSFSYMYERITLISLDVLFGLENKDGKTRPTIVSNIKEPLDKLDKVCKFISVGVVFTRSVLSSLPLGYRIRYRYLGNMILQENMQEQIFEDIEVYQKNISERLFKAKGFFERGVINYENKEYEKALHFFENGLKSFPSDKPCYVYYNKAKEKISKD